MKYKRAHRSAWVAGSLVLGWVLGLHADPVSLSVTRYRGLEWTTFIPYAPRALTIDGSLEDWPAPAGQAIAIDGTMVPQRGWAAPPPADDDDLSAQLYLAWNEEYFYVAARVRDDAPTALAEGQEWKSPYAHDGLVLHAVRPPWLKAGVRALPVLGEEASLGLSFHAEGRPPRPLQNGVSYVARRIDGGYVIEAAVPFRTLGWSPARAGDRFPLGVILIDDDPGKAGGERFDQYGWNFGPGSAAGMGEARLMGGGVAAGELIPARREVVAGSVVDFVGTIDAGEATAVAGIDVVRLDTGSVVLRAEAPHRLAEPGRYGVSGTVRLPDLPMATYELRLRWP